MLGFCFVNVYTFRRDLLARISFLYMSYTIYQTGTENTQRKLNAKEYYKSEIIRKEIKVPRSKIISNGLYGQKSKIIMRLLWSKLMKSKKNSPCP